LRNCDWELSDSESELKLLLLKLVLELELSEVSDVSETLLELDAWVSEDVSSSELRKSLACWPGAMKLGPEDCGSWGT
jgi:hypothetical protein